jgi:hypothetical protein
MVGALNLWSSASIKALLEMMESILWLSKGRKRVSVAFFPDDQPYDNVAVL